VSGSRFSAGYQEGTATGSKSRTSWDGAPDHRCTGDGNLRCTGFVEPADNIEFFLGARYDSTKRNGDRPDLFEVAWLMRRYRTEFSMVEIPAMVQQVVFPIQVLIGTLLGRYRRYAGAPQPIRRSPD
jgi:hypothetical protein